MGKTSLLLGLLCAAPAFAQSAAEPSVPLPPVEVPLPDADVAPASPSRATPSGLVTVVDTAERRGEAKDTAELLAPVPGAVLQDAGGLGQRKSLSLRGAGSSGVMVLLDGIPLSAPGESVDLSRIPAAIADRFEVLRGGAGARYGPGALGGVVNVVTRRPAAGSLLGAEATWGSFGTALASASASGKLLGGDGLVLVHGARSSGDFTFLYDRQPTLDGNALTPMVRANNQATAGGALFRFSTQLSGSTSLDLLGEGGADARGFAGTAQNPTPDASQTGGRGLLGARLTHHFESGGELSALGYGRLDDSVLLGSPLVVGPWHQTRGGAGLELAFSQLAFTRHGLSAAASVGTDWLQAPQDTRPGWVRGGLMLGDEVFFFDGALALNATVRVDQTGPFTGVSPRLGGLLLLPLGFELRLNAGQSHRPPTFLELYVKQGNLLPNPQLRPERGLGADAAIALRREQGFVQLGAFATVYEDLISYEYYPPLLARPYNFQAARVMGLEAEGTFAPTRWLSAAASYTLLTTQNLKDATCCYLKPLPYRPQHKLAGQLWLGPRWLRARGEVLFQSEQFLNRTGTVALPGRVFLNAGVVTQPLGSEKVSVALELKNLLDVQSQDLDGYPLPSRGAYLTLSVAWDATSALARNESSPPVVASRSPSVKELHP